MTWLIASLGTSPSVLTEALWYLETQKELAIDRMTCVGTQESLSQAEKMGMFAPGGALERLRIYLNEHHGKPKDWLTLGKGLELVIEDVPDNRDLAEAKAMDATFRRAIRDAQESEDHEGPVIACISGGRKSMSSSLQQAMALLARREDWAFHVLLNLPPGVDEADVFKSGFAFPGDPAHPAYAEVQIDAFEVPLVRLREFAETKGIKLTDDALVEKLQVAVDESRILPRLTLHLRTLTLRDESRPGWEQRLGPQQALLLAGFQMAGGPVTLDEVEPHLRKVIQLWKTLGVGQSTQIFPVFFEDLDEAIERWVDPRFNDQGQVINTFAPQVTNLKNALLGSNPSYHLFTLRASGRRDGRRGFDPMVYEQRLLRLAI